MFAGFGFAVGDTRQIDADEHEKILCKCLFQDKLPKPAERCFHRPHDSVEGVPENNSAVNVQGWILEDPKYRQTDETTDSFRVKVVVSWEYHKGFGANISCLDITAEENEKEEAKKNEERENVDVRKAKIQLTFPHHHNLRSRKEYARTCPATSITVIHR